MFDVVIFEDDEPVWCVNLAPLTKERAEECLRQATATGAAYCGHDVRILAS